MVSVFYMICVLVSTGNLVYLSQKKYKNTDRYLWTIVMLVPVTIAGYWIKSTVHTPEAAMISFCFIYLDSTVLPVVLLFSLLKSIGHEAGPWVKISVYTVTALEIFTVWFSRNTKLYYSAIDIEETSLGTVTRMTSGPLKLPHYIFLGVLAVAFIAVFIWGLLDKTKKSKKSYELYAFYATAMLAVYVIELVLGTKFTILPGLYTIGSIMIVVNYEGIQSHDIYNFIGEKQIITGHLGFCAFDLKRRLLGYNDQFAKMEPDVCNVSIDAHISEKYEDLFKNVNRAIDVFDENGYYCEKVEVKGKVFQIIVTDFSVSRDNNPNGYLLEVSDVTDDQKKIDTIEKYNKRLSEEVEAKTENILGIQNAVVLGLANMVENRDDNTGGHVKRTSEVIKLLVNEIQRQKIYNLDAQKAKDIVRAAPMHDLGKISIDSAILCKPGRLTPEEYEIMKTHAPKSGEIVKIILEGVEEQHFVDVSYNLARHHHERFDGKGYPEGLMGESIPVEARIMAVADVYDALVSKRCYKEAMSFEEAFKIMNDNMGSQFDPSMRPVFVACRQKLEAYYSQQTDAE